MNFHEFFVKWWQITSYVQHLENCITLKNAWFLIFFFEHNLECGIRLAFICDISELFIQYNGETIFREIWCYNGQQSFEKKTLKIWFEFSRNFREMTNYFIQRIENWITLKSTLFLNLSNIAWNEAKLSTKKRLCKHKISSTLKK